MCAMCIVSVCFSCSTSQKVDHPTAGLHFMSVITGEMWRNVLHLVKLFHLLQGLCVCMFLDHSAGRHNIQKVMLFINQCFLFEVNNQKISWIGWLVVSVTTPYFQFVVMHTGPNVTHFFSI